MTDNKKTLGLYIHIPFCLSKCRYCDFCSFPNSDESTVSKYINRLCGEIREHGKRFQEYTVDTVYFGGGTPTFIKISQFTDLMRSVHESFNISNDAEITTECNPKTVDISYLRALRGLGINRLSIGVQSMNDNELAALDRIHKADDAVQTVQLAREAGFENISVDIMFGIPEQTNDSFSRTLDKIIALSPQHISAYGLKIEENTYFSRHRDELRLPDEDEERSMYLTAVKKLSDNGFSRYEISNFAKEGKKSRHNLKYWHRDDYLGLGIAAHSCIGNKRFSSTCDINEFLNGKTVENCEEISQHDIMCEKIMLGMRLDEGVRFSDFGENGEKYARILDNYANKGFVCKTNGVYSFTNEGMYVSNYILSDMLDFDE